MWLVENSKRRCGFTISNLRAGGSRSPPLLEAFVAVNRTTLRRFKRHLGFPAATGADDGCFGFVRGAVACWLALLQLCLTGFATFGIVFEFLLGEELLFSRREDEIGAAVRAFQDSVSKFRHSNQSTGKLVAHQ
jgi:hypothetical protein